MRWIPILVGALLLAALVAYLAVPPSTDSEHEGAPERALPGSEAPVLEGRPEPPVTPPAPPAAPEQTAGGAWLLRGSVRGEDGAPIPGATVHLAFLRGPLRGALPSTTSDREGRFRIDLTARVREWTPARRATTHLVARAEAPGCRPGREVRTRSLPAALDTPPTLDLDLVLERGATVRGRVLGVEGQPQADAYVELAPLDGSQAVAASTDAQGRYALGVPADGLFRVLARAYEGGGFGVLGPLRLQAGRSESLDDLRLLSAGSIEGRVVFADGSPAAGVWLRLDLRTPSDKLPQGLTKWQVPRQSAAHSDAAGRFRFHPARAGTYEIVLRDAFGGPEGTRCPSGSRDVRVVVPLHELVVRVRDSDGTPLLGAPYGVTGFRAEQREIFERALRGEIEPRELSRLAWASLGASVDSPDGEIRLFVPHDSAWLFSFTPEGLPPVEHAVRVPGEGNRSTWDLVVGPPVAVGRLELSVIDEEGEPIEAFDFELRTNLGGILATSREQGPDALRNLPAGTYKLRLDPGPARHALDRMYQVLSPFLPIHADATVTAGGATRLTLRARRGGWVRLHPILPAGGDPPKRGAARLHVKPDVGDAPWTYVPRFVYTENGRLRGTSDLRPGRPARIGRLFQPGLHHFRLQVEGYETAEFSVRVTAGEETPVEVRLEPAD